MQTGRGFQLTYCSNIHPASGWRQVSSGVQQVTTALKGRLQPHSRFGLGLRLSDLEATELLSDANLADFQGVLADSGIYVALLNGFPFGDFHNCCVKDQVFAPDWHQEDRVRYTCNLVKVLGRLLPDDLHGGVSTSPLSYKRWDQAPDWDLLVRNVVRVAHCMVDVQRETGRLIHLDIEPEPDGLLENTGEFVSFFQRLLHRGTPLLAAQAQMSLSEAENALRTHINLCYDLCHFAVERQSPSQTLTALRSAGISIGRVQVSSALSVTIPASVTERQAVREQLAHLADSTYLHQIIGDHARYADLPQGLAEMQSTPGGEWRIHYHVPLFLNDYGTLHSTQADVRAALAQLTVEDANHLEIETYTWGVLPEGLKLQMLDSIEREYRWVLPQV